MLKFIAVLFLSLGIVSCNSCSKKPTDTETIIPIPTNSVNNTIPTTQEVVGINFKFVVPANWDKKDPPLDSNIKEIYFDEKEQMLVMLSTQPFEKPQDEFVLLGIRELKDNGIDVKNAEEISLNNKTFVRINTSQEKNNVYAILWLSVNNNIAFNLSCAGKDILHKEEISKVCEEIAKSLVLQ